MGWQGINGDDTKGRTACGVLIYIWGNKGLWGIRVGKGYACGVGNGIFFLSSHYKVKNNNYTFVYCGGIILGGRISAHPCGRGKSTVCDA